MWSAELGWATLGRAVGPAGLVHPVGAEEVGVEVEAWFCWFLWQTGQSVGQLAPEWRAIGRAGVQTRGGRSLAISSALDQLTRSSQLTTGGWFVREYQRYSHDGAQLEVRPVFFIVCGLIRTWATAVNCPSHDAGPSSPSAARSPPPPSARQPTQSQPGRSPSPARAFPPLEAQNSP